MNRWRPKIEALRRLIAPGSGATDAERETAKHKLEGILRRHYGDEDGARRYAAFSDAISRDSASTDEALAAAFSGEDFREMVRRGVSMEGRWTAPTTGDAVRMMVADYARRLRANKNRRQLVND